MTKQVWMAGLLMSVVGLSACSNQAKLDAQAAKAERQIESTERAARDAQRRLDKQ